MFDTWFHVARQGLEALPGVVDGMEKSGPVRSGWALPPSCDPSHRGKRWFPTAGTVRDLIAGSGIEMLDRGLHQLKGVEGAREIYAVDHGDCPIGAATDTNPSRMWVQNHRASGRLHLRASRLLGVPGPLRYRAANPEGRPK
jgi:hypothetical protein